MASRASNATVLQVLVAHSGRSLDLEVQPSTRVDAVQQILVSHAGIRAGEQILMCDGRPLDASQPLSAYKLPVDGAGTARDVFLYNKSHLRSGGAVPEPETLPPLHVEEPAAGTLEYEAHPLDTAPSPLLRALPAYERDFRTHVRLGQEYQRVAQERLAIAQRLLAEMNAQGTAIDAARMNVEHHYTYIQDVSADFLRRYRAQAAAHEEVLNGFERDMNALAAAELHPAARVGDATRLLDLLPEAKLRDWAANCRQAHSQFAEKVAGLEGLFAALRTDVEALFMQAPPVNLDDLAHKLAHDMQLHVDEQASIASALVSDYRRVQGLVEEAVRALSARPGAASVGPLDAAGVMDTMHESHVGQLLPRLAEGDAALARFTEHCLECKNQMTREVVDQLRRISSQQSKISRARGQLSVFRQVAGRQAEAIAELLLPRRLPAAYRHCLAECMRRRAFAEVYAGQAGELAERMARLRSKEDAAREAFRSAVERHIPSSVLSALGLLGRPPHCDISVPPPDTGLADITPDDLKHAPAAQRQVQLATPFSAGSTPRSLGASPHRESRLLSQPSSPAAAPALAVAAEAAIAAEQDELSADPFPQSMEMENARLRAELATQVARTCMAEQAAIAASGRPAASPARTSRQHSGSSESQRGSGELRHSGSDTAEDMAARFQEALSAKDDVVARLDHELTAARQQASVYEARILALEQLLHRNSMAAGASPASSQQSSLTASAVAPSAAASPVHSPADTLAHPLQPPAAIEVSPRGGSSPRPAMDPLQRAASGTVTAPSADRPPLSPRLPPSSSPRALGGSGLLPPLSLAPLELQPPVVPPSAAAASALTPDSNIQAQAQPQSGALPSVVASDAAAAEGSPEPGPGPAASQPASSSGSLDTGPASEGHTVVPSPSLTSLADAAMAASDSQSVSSSVAHIAAAPTTEPAETAAPEPAATSGFRVTGFRVPSSEHVTIPERTVSEQSSCSSASRPQPSLPQFPAVATLSGAVAAPRHGSAGLADILDDATSRSPPPAPAQRRAATPQPQPWPLPLPMSPPEILDEPSRTPPSASPRQDSPRVAAVLQTAAAEAQPAAVAGGDQPAGTAAAAQGVQGAVLGGSSGAAPSATAPQAPRMSAEEGSAASESQYSDAGSNMQLLSTPADDAGPDAAPPDRPDEAATAHVHDVAHEDVGDEAASDAGGSDSAVSI